PEQPDRFDRDTWTVHDLMQTPWPFPDKYFDFCFCSHLLEDLTDPISTCHKMMRVSKARYIETPSRVREIFTKERLLWLRGLFGTKPQIGDPHHHWLVEVEGGHIRFTRKTDLVFDSRFCLSRTNVGRKLTSMESGTCL
ncbi:MAG TPA: methyltransferase domain-containing protein, partial [Rhodospirillales bacterium]|nr:methyltransferase domain-containing protein [Rhodospirillales bacterium]